VAAGDTYAFDPQMYVKMRWPTGFAKARTPTVAEQDRHGCRHLYFEGQSRRGGSHVANAAFMVALNARGQGIGRGMGEHCLSESRRIGFRAMQFILLFPRRIGAALWYQLGFKSLHIAGAFPASGEGICRCLRHVRSLL